MRKFVLVLVVALLLVGCGQDYDALQSVESEFGEEGSDVVWQQFENDVVSVNFPLSLWDTNWKQQEEGVDSKAASWLVRYYNQQLVIEPDWLESEDAEAVTYNIRWTDKEDVFEGWKEDGKVETGTVDCGKSSYACKNYVVSSYQQRSDAALGSDFYFLEAKKNVRVPFVMISAPEGVYPDYVEKVLLHSLKFK